MSSKRKHDDDAVGAAKEGGEAAAPGGESQPSAGKKGKYRRDKPWDHDGIDHWKVGLLQHSLTHHTDIHCFS
jgi:ribosomal RNA assembly protein